MKKLQNFFNRKHRKKSMTEIVIDSIYLETLTWYNIRNSKLIRTSGSSSKSYCMYLIFYKDFLFLTHIFLSMYLCKEDGNYCSSILLISIEDTANSSRVFPLSFLIGLKTQLTMIIMSHETCFALGTTNGKAMICLSLQDS